MFRYRTVKTEYSEQEESPGLEAVFQRLSSIDFLPEAPVVRSLVYAVALSPVSVSVHETGVSSYFSIDKMKISLELPPPLPSRRIWRTILYARAIHEAAHCRYFVSKGKKVKYRDTYVTEDQYEFLKFMDRVKKEKPQLARLGRDIFNILIDAIHENRIIDEMPAIAKSIEFYRKWLLFNYFKKISGRNLVDYLHAAVQVLRCQGLNTNIRKYPKLVDFIKKIFGIYKKAEAGEIPLSEAAWKILCLLEKHVPNLEKIKGIAPDPDIAFSIPSSAKKSRAEENAAKAAAASKKKKEKEEREESGEPLSKSELEKLLKPAYFTPSREAEAALKKLSPLVPISKPLTVVEDAPRDLSAELKYREYLRRRGFIPYLSKFWGVAAIVKPDINRDWRKRWLRRRVSWNMSELNTTAAKIANQIQSQLLLPEERIYGYRGRFCVDQYVRVTLPTGRMDIYETEAEETPPQESVVFGLLLDCSGSMSGEKIIKSAQSAYIVSKALSIVGIKHGIFAWTDFTDPQSPWYERTEILVIKDFSAPLTEKTVDILRSLSGLRDNSDHIAIETVAETMAAAYPSVKKVLIVLSDGIPVSCMYSRINGVGVTKAVVDYYRRQGIYIGCVYLKPGFAEETSHRIIYGKKNVWTVDSPHDLPKTFHEILMKLTQLLL